MMASLKSTHNRAAEESSTGNQASEMSSPPEELKRRVENYLNGVLAGKKINLVYDSSKAGQSYAILLTEQKVKKPKIIKAKIVWYTVSLFLENEYPNWPNSFLKNPILGGLPRPNVFAISRFSTLPGAEDRVQEYLGFFNSPTADGAEKIMKIAGFKTAEIACRLPSNWASTPDQYIKRGDIIRPFSPLSNKAAVYMGKGKVIYFDLSKAVGTDREIVLARDEYKKGKLIPDLVGDKSDGLVLVYQPLQLQRREFFAVTLDVYTDPKKIIKYAVKAVSFLKTEGMNEILEMINKAAKRRN